MTTVIEFNDLEFSLFRGRERLYQAPGFAIVRESELLFGEPALRIARIHPQQANQQYFSRMNADPLPRPVPIAANHADLVYLHLKELAGLSQDDAVLAVPGTMNGDQLGILLGICQESGIEVSGFVNAAVAAVTTTAAPETVAYLDVFLQHMQVSELNVDDEVHHQRSFEVRDCGFSGLLEGWVNLIADRFVQETRFDPLHTAESEQQLYNQVYDWVTGAHHHKEVAVEILNGEQRRRVEIPRQRLEQKAHQRLDRLVDALPRTRNLILTARTARLPGLTDRLKAAGFELEMLVADAVAAGCSNHLDLIRTAASGLRLISRLPHEHQTNPSARRTPVRPTHLLSNHVARPLAGAGLALAEREDGIYLTEAAGIELNGDPATADARLSPGDVITRGSENFTLIRLEG